MGTYTAVRQLERFVLILVLLSWAPLAAAQTPEPSTAVAEPGATLASAADAAAHRLAAQATVRVDRRRNDSVLNGAIIGAAAGVASGLFLCRLTEPWENCRDDVGPMVRIGALGAGIGIAIDALIRERETVYIPAGSSQVYVAPVARRGAKGVQVAVRF